MRALIKPWVLLTIALLSIAFPVYADPTLEMQSGVGGPGGNGPTTAAQTVVLQNNTNNWTGNTFAAYAPPAPLQPLDVTVSLGNFNPLLIAPTVNGNMGALFFGGTQNNAAAQALGAPIYDSLGALGTPSNVNYTSTGGSPAGQGIGTVLNGGLEFLASAKAICNVPAATRPATNARVFLAEMTLTFNRPVNNPILHFAGLGGSSPGGNGFSTEFDALDGLSLTRLSGNTALSVSGASINSSAAAMSASCTTNAAACGSVQVNTTQTASYRFNVYLRGDGTGSWCSSAGGGNAHTGDSWLLGVSVDPTPIVQVRKTTLLGTGTFDFTGSNNFGSDQATTAAINAPVAANGGPHVLAAAYQATTITETAQPGWKLTDISCTGIPAGTFTTDLTAGTVTLDSGVSGRVPATGTTTNSYATAPLNSNIVCTFTNSRFATDLVISKTNTPLAGVVDQATDTLTRGSATTYTLAVTNNGPDPATGALIKDVPIASLNCPAGNSVTITGPGAPSGSFTISNLTGAGITLGTLNAGQTVTLSFTCNVL